MQTNCIGMALEEDRIKSMNWFMGKSKFQEDTEVWIFLVENWWYDHFWVNFTKSRNIQSLYQTDAHNLEKIYQLESQCLWWNTDN